MTVFSVVRKQAFGDGTNSAVVKVFWTEQSAIDYAALLDGLSPSSTSWEWHEVETHEVEE